MNKANIKNAQTLIDGGGIPIVWPKEDLQKIETVGGPVVEKAWIKSLKDRGLPAEEMLSRYKGLVKKYETNSPYVNPFKICLKLYEQKKK